MIAGGMMTTKGGEMNGTFHKMYMGVYFQEVGLEAGYETLGRMLDDFIRALHVAFYAPRPPLEHGTLIDA